MLFWLFPKIVNMFDLDVYEVDSYFDIQLSFFHLPTEIYLQMSKAEKMYIEICKIWNKF